jgi:hypothetical protein
MAIISNKKKCRKLAGSGQTKKDLNQIMSTETVYSLRGSKSQALQGLDKEEEDAGGLE